MPPTVIPCKLPHDFPPGTYFRNGHGRFVADDGTTTAHMLDGDGMITALTFDPENYPNQALFRNRFVRTIGYLTDKETKKMSARGVFGTMRSGGLIGNAFRTNFKNVANTNILYRPSSTNANNEKLFALWEAGRPHVLDPLTLKTYHVKESTLNGILKDEKEFSAHPVTLYPRLKPNLEFGILNDNLSR